MSASTPDSTGQVGLAQVGIAQVGDASLAGSTIALNGSIRAPAGVNVTALRTGGRLSGGATPTLLSGANTSPIEVIVKALTPGALSGGIPQGTAKKGRGFWPWEPSKHAFDVLTEGIE